MRITRLKIQGLGPHSDTNIDFGALDSPIAIVAPYGSGKTSMLESILICLYGAGGWYTGNAYELLTQGGTGRGTVELYFEHNGDDWKAVREIKDSGKTKSQTATLWCHGAGTVAGPKTSDFEAYIANMLGDFRTFLATQFLAQNRAYDLCGQPGESNLAARRREVFGELLEVSMLDAHEARFAELQRAAEAEAKVLEHQLLGQADPQAALQEAEVTLGNIEVELHGLERLLATEEENLRNAEAALAKADNGDAHRLTISKFDMAWLRRDGLRDQDDDLRNRHTALYLRAKKADEAKERVINAEYMRRDMAELKRRQEAYAKWWNWSGDFERHKTRVGFLQEQIEEKRKQTVISPEVREDALHLARNRDLLEGAKRKNAEAAVKNGETTKTMLYLEREVSALESQLADLRKRLSERPETPGGDFCKDCLFVAQYATIPMQINEKELRLGEMRSALTEVPALVPIQDLEELTLNVWQSEAAAQEVFKASDAHDKVAEMVKRLEMEQAELAAKEAAQPEQVADPSMEIDILQRQIDAVAGADAELRAAEQAQAELNDVVGALRQTEVMLAEAQAEVEGLRDGADAARKALEDAEAGRVELKRRVDSVRQSVANLRGEVKGRHTARGQAEGEVARWRDRIEETAAKREESERLRGYASACRDLRSCFGPRGVRQILVDAAAPQLEAIADELFDRATGGRQRLRIATQRVLADGGVSEDFSILVADERGERDATRFSGGQLQLIQILFRLSVALWAGRIKGRRPDLLILDEAFDRLGAEGSEDLLRVLQHLADEIGQIIVVSHNPEIAARLRSQVALTKGAGGVLVA